MSKGCVVVLRPSQELQSTMSYEILRSEGGGCFRQEKSDDYTVAVFKQTMNKTLHASALKVSVASLSYSTLITRKLNDNVDIQFSAYAAIIPQFM